MAAKIRYLRKQPIHICANAKSVFVQPWRAVFAHSSPHCPLTPCQRWNTNIEQAKNEKSSILACPQEFTSSLINSLRNKKQGKFALRCSSANWNGIFDKKLRNFNIRQSLTKNSAGSGFSHLQQVIRATMNAICLDSNQKSVRINEIKYIFLVRNIFSFKKDFVCYLVLFKYVG